MHTNIAIDFIMFVPEIRSHSVDCQDAVVSDLPSAGFSLISFGLNVASWSVILRPKALSTFAPSASLLRLSLFSGVG